MIPHVFQGRPLLSSTDRDAPGMASGVLMCWKQPEIVISEPTTLNLAHILAFVFG